MMGKEIITRLNIKTVDFESNRGGYGGLTTSDICASMAGSNKAGMALLIERVAGSRCIHSSEFYILYRQVVDLSIAGKWMIKKNTEQLRTMLQMAILEHCVGGSCQSCKGARYQKIDLSKVCRRCKGTGHYHLTNEQKAKVISVRKSTWISIWEDRYYTIQLLLSEMEYFAMKTIYNQLK